MESVKEYIIAICLPASIILNIVYLWMTNKILKHDREPQIIAYIEWADGELPYKVGAEKPYPRPYYICIENVGTQPAKEIKEKIYYKNDKRSDRKFSKNLDILTLGDKLLFRIRNGEEVIKVDIKYKSIDGKKYKRSFNIDRYSRMMVTSDKKEIKDSLKAIAGGLSAFLKPFK